MILHSVSETLASVAEIALGVRDLALRRDTRASGLRG